MKRTFRRVRQTAMAWHVNHLQKEGWTMTDIKIGERSGKIKRAEFVRDPGTESEEWLYLEPKVLTRYRHHDQDGRPNKWVM